jgi:uncharacterized protein (TIGR01244 family)
MYCVRCLTVFLLLVSSVPAQDVAPDWSKKTFSAPTDRVFTAALTSIAAQHHEVKSKDDVNRVVTFHVGITAWSWGYNMILKVAPGENHASDVSVEIARSGGKAVSWGSGKKEVQKIFNGIEKELAKAPAVAQEVSTETVDGVTNFHRLGTTVACAGATKAEAVPEIKKMGFASIINLRQAGEPGADIEAEEVAAKAADIRYYHIPMNPTAPEQEAADKFLDAITTQGSEPAFIHCAGGGRAATMWFIKRLVVDHWDVERAEKEAAALGMTNPALKQFAIDYAQTHKR